MGRLAQIPTWRVLARRVGAGERALALACLERVGLAELADARSDRLSGGQQQRVAIARALAQRIAVVCSLHQVELVAGFADRVIGLRDGHKVLDVAADDFGPEEQAAVYVTAPVALTTDGVGR